MPTDRFQNLPMEKKKVILKAAIKEFVRVPFEKTSINKIIQNAGISRGSFYTYFKDKNDVLGYIFEVASKKLQNSWSDYAEKYNGDIWKISEAILEYIISNPNENKVRLMKSIVCSERMFGVSHQLLKINSPDICALQELIYDTTNKTEFKDQSSGFFGILLTMILTEIVQCFEWYFKHPEDKEKIKKIFHVKLEILQYGIYQYEL